MSGGLLWLPGGQHHPPSPQPLPSPGLERLSVRCSPSTFTMTVGWTDPLPRPSRPWNSGHTRRDRLAPWPTRECVGHSPEVGTSQSLWDQSREGDRKVRGQGTVGLGSAAWLHALISITHHMTDGCQTRHLGKSSLLVEQLGSQDPSPPSSGSQPWLPVEIARNVKISDAGTQTQRFPHSCSEMWPGHQEV